MLVAVDDAGVRRTASPAMSGLCCPGCGRELIVRVPARKVAHFAHKPGEACNAADLAAARRREVASARREKAKVERFAALKQFEAEGQQALFPLEDATHPTVQRATPTGTAT